MKNILLIILVGIFVISGFAEVIASDQNKNYSNVLTNSCIYVGNTLITEYLGNRVIEIDTNGNIVWQKTGLAQPHDAERLENGNTLIVESIGKVIEVDNSGAIVWQITGLNGQLDAERLDNGNTLIVETPSKRVIEVDNSGAIVWQITGLDFPFDAERLDNGNTLIVEPNDDMVIEVDNSGAIVWEKTGIESPTDAERLENGNTLIVLSDWVIEVDNSGAIVWQIRVFEVDNSGAIVWEKTGLNNPCDAERIEPPPEPPSITGETEGQYGEEYEYTFVSTDPEDQDIRYYIDWGDGTNSGWIGPYNSGQEITESHTWDARDTYTIRAKAKDIFDEESQWGTLEVTMPVNQQFYSFPLLQRLLELFPNMFPILRNLLEAQY